MSLTGRSLERLLAQLPEDPVRRGREFERLCKWLLENDPVYRAHLKKVWHWNRWPGRWGRDAGIDLVAEAHDGSLWAIQAKAYAPNYPIKKEDVDTFLSESARPQFAYRLIIATTDQIGSNARQVLNGQQIPVGKLLRSELLSASVVWPTSFADLRAGRPRPKRPRPHQRRAVRDVVKGLEVHDRGQLVMACGTGKTLTSLFVAEALQTRRVLFLVPSLALLSQVITEWTSGSVGPLDYIAVCSDDSVVGEDEAVSTTSDLPFPVTTDPVAISQFLRARAAGRRVVFSTYQSSERVAKAMTASRVPAFDLIVADEAHRLVGRPDRGFATVLRDAELRANRRLFMTATPRRFTGRVMTLAREKDLEVASMDDERLFGPRLHTLTFSRAISAGLLSDYRVAVLGIDDRFYRDWVEQGLLIRSDGLRDMDARILAAHIGLAKAIRRFDIRRAISFHGRVKGAQTFARDFGEVVTWMPARERPSGSVYADFVSGEMPVGARRTKLQALQDPPADRALLTNARCLTEGIDVPALDGVAFIDPRRSEVDVVQAVGRAIRLSGSKKVGTIVIPIFVGGEADFESTLQKSVFRTVWDVVNALRAHDEGLALELDAVRQELGARDGYRAPLPSKLHIDLPSWVDQRFSQAIRLELVEQTTARWEFWLGLLSSFAAREGHARVHPRHVERGYQLGAWVGTQRATRAELAADRRTRLEQIPGWTWTPYVDDWLAAYSLLQEFVKRENAARVPLDHLEDGFPLGRWVARQRQHAARLGPERRALLEEIQGWSWDPRVDGWEEAFLLLLNFAEREGHGRVPPKHSEAGYTLGRWVTRQRRLREALDPERRRRLESVAGWSWDPHTDSWDAAYDLLLSFVAREGHSRVTRAHREQGRSLGPWVTEQRRLREKLDPERRRRLEQTPGWSWDPVADHWELGFRLLSVFSEREGHSRVHRDFEADGFALGRWAIDQRRRRAKLSPERRRRLEQIPGWSWNPIADQWERGYGLLLTFAEREGTARLPRGHLEDGFALGEWVNNQRGRRSKLSPDRRQKLENIPGWTWRLLAEDWEEAFSLLVRYSKREGHACVPKDHREGDYRLGTWVQTQRRRKETLDLKLKSRLEQVPGWSWNPLMDAWELAFARLISFSERFGHGRVPRNYRENNLRLGDWVVQQRRQRDSLDSNRRARLEGIPGWSWDPIADQWDSAFALLLTFQAREGHARVPQLHQEEGFALGRWVSNQRTRRRSLSPERQQRLSGVAGWTWSAIE